MKKYSDKEIKSFLEDLENGVVFVGIKNGCGVGKIVDLQYNWIEWSYYGNSCCYKTVDDLRFVLENIFGDCEKIVPAEYSKYHINYIPVNKKYKGIDFSFTHQNVYGL